MKTTFDVFKYYTILYEVSTKICRSIRPNFKILYGIVLILKSDQCRAGYSSVLFDDMDFQIIEIYAFNKIILCKPRFIVPPELRDGGVQPDRLS